jgi:hypothetical protein
MIGYKYPPIASGATYIRSTGGAPNNKRTNWLTSDIGTIDYLSSTTNFDFIVDKIKIGYSNRELFMRV